MDIYTGILEKIINNSKKNKMKIVLPESDDKRILEAANIASKEGIANIILIGNTNAIEDSSKKYDIVLDKNIVIVDPNTDSNTKLYAEKLHELRKHKNMSAEEATNLIYNNIYFATMMVYMGDADGMVSGANHSTSDTLRPALQIIKQNEKVKCVSSFFLMETHKKEFGSDGLFIFSDCGLNEDPTEEQLQDIAISSAESFRTLVGKEPKVVFLSYSTLGSAKSEKVDKIRRVVDSLKERNVDFKFDGELQLDAAIIKEVAQTKAPESRVAGEANVLIFPNIEAGNIGYKMAERFGDMLALGPVTQGMKKPVNDLSRGSSVEEIVGVIAITCVQAMNNK